MKEQILNNLLEELEAFSSGSEHIDESVAPLVVSMMKLAYNQGRRDENESLLRDNRPYSKLLKKKTFNRWLQKRFLK